MLAAFVWDNYKINIFRKEDKQMAKRVLVVDDAIFMTKLMEKDETLKEKLSSFFNNQTGFYFV